jgi:hypothetical protein
MPSAPSSLFRTRALYEPRRLFVFPFWSGKGMCKSKLQSQFPNIWKAAVIMARRDQQLQVGRTADWCRLTAGAVGRGSKARYKQKCKTRTLTNKTNHMTSCDLLCVTARLEFVVSTITFESAAVRQGKFSQTARLHKTPSTDATLSLVPPPGRRCKWKRGKERTAAANMPACRGALLPRPLCSLGRPAAN